MGTRGEVDKCPVCIAIRERFPNQSINVALTFPEREAMAYINHREYALPGTCKQFIEAFDAGEAVAPFSFYLQRGK